MRTFLPIILALGVLAACDSESTSEPLASKATTSTAPARAAERPTTTTSTTAASAPTTTQPVSSADANASCSESELDAATLQQSVDDGHQPWRGDPEMVAAAGAACSFGGPAASVEPAGVNHYLATSAATGDHVVVEIAQPLGPGTVWLISNVTPTP